MGERRSLASRSNTTWTLGGWGAQIAGFPLTKIPAFSAAIFSRVSPSHCIWSRPMGVITHTSAGTVVVASSLPPMPVSRTISSHSRRRNQRIASTNVISKNVGCVSIRSHNARSSVSIAAQGCSGISSPLTWIRSRKSMRCGEVKSPQRWPQARAMRSIIAQVLPLPLVPATWMTFTPCAG